MAGESGNGWAGGATDGAAPTAIAEPGGEPILSIWGLSKTFPGTRALADVDFDVRPGEVHALVGQNGSGKSTLIKVLAGFHSADPGATAEFAGESFRLGDSHAAHAAGLRFVHQDLGLVPTLNAIDNLALGVGYVTGRAGRIQWRRQAKVAHEAIKAIGYRVDVRTSMARLEPVERTAVAIARALLELDGKVSLLVLDEPTATMPRPEVERLFRIVENVKSRGVGVLYVSHHLDEIFAIADRVTVFRDGMNVGTRPVAGLSRRELIELMTGGLVDEAPSDSTSVVGEAVMQLSSVSGRELTNFDLTVHCGEVVGVAGITGSGREELCALIFGGRRRTGAVTVDGKTLEAMSPDRAVALGVGLVPADRHADGLVMTFNVRENLTLGHLGPFWERFRLRHREERRDAAASIKEFGVVAPSCETTVESLSGGNQQKIVLARWLRLKPHVLLLDEPTQGVDVASKAEVHRLIDRAATDGMSVLVCSSDEAELERLCDRVVVVRSGRAVAEYRRPNISAKRLAQESLGLEHAPTNGKSAAS